MRAVKVLAVLYLISTVGHSTTYKNITKEPLYELLSAPDRFALSVTCKDEYNRASKDAKFKVMIIFYHKHLNEPTLEFFNWRDLKSMIDLYKDYSSGKIKNNSFLAMKRELENKEHLYYGKIGNCVVKETEYLMVSGIAVFYAFVNLIPFISSLPYNVGSPIITYEYSSWSLIPQRIEKDFPWSDTAIGAGLLMVAIVLVFKAIQNYNERNTIELKQEINRKDSSNLHNSMVISKKFLIELGHMVGRKFLDLEPQELLKLKKDISLLSKSYLFRRIWWITGLDKRQQFDYETD